MSVIDRNFQVPYIGGSSASGKCVYIDKRLPKTLTLKDGRVMPLDRFLKVHEETEKRLEDQGYSYQHSHEVATGAERKAVEAAGFPWREYQDFMLKEVKKLARLTDRVPSDIDVQPDRDSHDTAMLRSIRKHQEAKKPWRVQLKGENGWHEVTNIIPPKAGEVANHYKLKDGRKVHQKDIVKLDMGLGESRAARLLSRIQNEKLILKDYSAYAKMVADAYDAAPVHEPEADASYRALMDHTEKLFKQMQSKIKVEFVDEDPYKSSDDMINDINKNHVLKIWTGASDHPIWTPEQNWKFRAVHDYYSHILGVSHGGHKFDLRGEMNAFNRHAKLVPPEALGALFTEVIGQVGWGTIHGGFPTQKAALLKGFDYKKIGDVDDIEYQKNFK